MAVNRYSGGMQFPKFTDLAGKQNVYKWVAMMINMKAKTRPWKARAAFQLPSITTEAGYPSQISTRYFPSVVVTVTQVCAYHMPNSSVMGEDVPNVVLVNLRKTRLRASGC